MTVIRVPKLTLYGTIDSYEYVEIADETANVVADSDVNTTVKKTAKKSVKKTKEAK